MLDRKLILSESKKLGLPARGKTELLASLQDSSFQINLN
jgi:hypothetical protein